MARPATVPFLTQFAALHDDLARLRTGHGPANMAVVKNMALNLLKHAKPTIGLKKSAQASRMEHRLPRGPHPAGSLTVHSIPLELTPTPIVNPSRLRYSICDARRFPLSESSARHSLTRSAVGCPVPATALDRS